MEKYLAYGPKLSDKKGVEGRNEFNEKIYHTTYNYKQSIY